MVKCMIDQSAGTWSLSCGRVDQSDDGIAQGVEVTLQVNTMLVRLLRKATRRSLFQAGKAQQNHSDLVDVSSFRRQCSLLRIVAEIDTRKIAYLEVVLIPLGLSHTTAPVSELDCIWVAVS